MARRKLSERKIAISITLNQAAYDYVMELSEESGISASSTINSILVKHAAAEQEKEELKEKNPITAEQYDHILHKLKMIESFMAINGGKK